MYWFVVSFQGLLIRSCPQCPVDDPTHENVRRQLTSAKESPKTLLHFAQDQGTRKCKRCRWFSPGGDIGEATGPRRLQVTGTEYCKTFYLPRLWVLNFISFDCWLVKMSGCKHRQRSGFATGCLSHLYKTLPVLHNIYIWVCSPKKDRHSCREVGCFLPWQTLVT